MRGSRQQQPQALAMAQTHPCSRLRSARYKIRAKIEHIQVLIEMYTSAIERFSRCLRRRLMIRIHSVRDKEEGKRWLHMYCPHICVRRSRSATMLNEKVYPQHQATRRIALDSHRVSPVAGQLTLMARHG